MSSSDEITKAMSAHAKWKYRLEDAIASSKSDISVEQAASDNRCDFGKWFYSLPVSVRESPEGKRIQKLHAAFHAETARILGLALRGAKDEATKAMSLGSSFKTYTGELTLALTDWKEKFR